MLSLAARFLAGSLLPLALLSAQVTPTPLPLTPVQLPPDLCAALEVRAGTAQDLILPSALGSPFEVAVHLAGAACSLQLTPNDVRTPDFALYMDDATGLHRLPTPPSVTYQGTVSGLDGGDVAASLIDGQLHAMVRLGDGTIWTVQPLSAVNATLPRGAHAVYRGADVVTDGLQCGVTAHAEHAGGNGSSTGPAAMKVAELAVDADLRYYQRHGSNTTTAQNQVTTVINAVNAIYRRDVEIDHRITTIIVRTTNIYAWTGDLCNLLGQFGSYWSANHGNVRRDVAHLFTGEGSFSGVIGCAYVGVVCTGSSYGSSKAFSSSLNTNAGLVAHEMGHNWGAGHCNSSSPCNIMCSGLGGCSGSLGSFAPVSISAIVAHKNSRGCLDDPIPTNPPVLGGLLPNSTPIHGATEITAVGSYLNTVTSVTVGGVNAAFTLVNSGTLRFTLPAGPIATHQVVAINALAPSNPLPLNVLGNHPSELVISQILPRGFTGRVTLHSDRSWVGAVLLSSSNAPSAVPGLVSLGIGNGFTDLFELGILACGTDGAAVVNFLVPGSAPQITVYWQAVTLDPTNLVVPLEVSNVVPTFLF